MTHTHDHGAASGRTLSANASPWPHSSEDPTATKTLRDRYAGEMYRRFRALKGAIRTTVVDRDAFGLKGDSRSVRPRGQADREVAGNAQDPDINIGPAGYNDFAFPSDQKKADEFMSWLDEQTDRGILQAGRHADRGTSASASWQNTYIRSAYEKGVTHADSALVQQGVIPPEQTLDDVFRATRHADSAGLIYSRAYRELRGVTEAMGQEMTRELTEGLTQGENPRKIARRLNDRVDKIGITRGRMVARTETIRAHNEAALNRYDDMGGRIDGVSVMAEHVTAGDRRVCPICRSLNGSEYTINEARGRIPVHPRCRCTWVPTQTETGSGGGGGGTDTAPDAPATRPAESIDSTTAVSDLPDRGDFDTSQWDDLAENTFFESDATKFLEENTDIGRVDIDEMAFSFDEEQEALHEFGKEVLRLDDAGLFEDVKQLKIADPDTDRDYGGLYMRRNPGGSPVDEDHGIFVNANGLKRSHSQIGDGVNSAGKRTIRHELGHHRHARAIERGDPDEDLYNPTSGKMTYDLSDDEKDYIEENLTPYAARNTNEFIAEMHTYLTEPTETVDDERLVSLYERLMGING